MVKLKAFKPNGKNCNWPGCSRKAVNTTLPVKGNTIHCIRHNLIKHSGRVGPSWRRDHYREHLKGITDKCGIRWIDVYQEVIYTAKEYGYTLSKVEAVRRTSQSFDVDHHDGNHRNNHPSNLKTLTTFQHRLKSRLAGDHNPMRNKK